MRICATTVLRTRLLVSMYIYKEWQGSEGWRIDGYREEVRKYGLQPLGANLARNIGTEWADEGLCRCIQVDRPNV